MALIVEDGSGNANAESYESVEYADAYHLNLGNSAWTGTTGAKEIALRQAAIYLDAVYGPILRGERSTQAQGRAFPRMNVIDDDGYTLDSSGADSIPPKLKMAQAEVALEAIKGTALFVTELTPGNLKSESIKVGGIEIAEEFAGSRSQQPRFPIVEALLAGFVEYGFRRVRG